MTRSSLSIFSRLLLFSATIALSACGRIPAGCEHYSLASVGKVLKIAEQDTIESLQRYYDVPAAAAARFSCWGNCTVVYQARDVLDGFLGGPKPNMFIVRIRWENKALFKPFRRQIYVSSCGKVMEQEAMTV